MRQTLVRVLFVVLTVLYCVWMYRLVTQ